MTEVTAFVDLVAKYGLWVVFAFLWYLERGERKEIQKERNDLVKSVFDAIAALKELRKVIRGDGGD